MCVGGPLTPEPSEKGDESDEEPGKAARDRALKWRGTATFGGNPTRERPDKSARGCQGVPAFRLGCRGGSYGSTPWVSPLDPTHLAHHQNTSGSGPRAGHKACGPRRCVRAGRRAPGSTFRAPFVLRGGDRGISAPVAPPVEREPVTGVRVCEIFLSLHPPASCAPAVRVRRGRNTSSFPA